MTSFLRIPDSPAAALAPLAAAASQAVEARPLYESANDAATTAECFAALEVTLL